MPTILKQFSLEDSKEPTHKNKKQDYLQGKYITPVIEPILEKKINKTDRIKKHLSSSHSQQTTNKQSLQNIFLFPTFSWKNYLRQLPTLFLGIISYAISFTILNKIQPSAVKDLFIPNSYVTLVLFLGLGHFFSLWYLTQHFRRSILIALLLSAFLFLRIHQTWSPFWLVIISFAFITPEFLLTYRSFRR